MQQLPKEFMGRMVRTVLFIGLVAACCAGVATFGMFVASKFNLTTSRSQIHLTSVKIEGEKVLIPENGKTTREAGWTLRNNRGLYILTLDELEAGSKDTSDPVIEVDADHPSAVRLEAGDMNFTGAGFGIVDETVELAGAQGTIEAASASGAAVKTAHIKREGSNSDKLELIGDTAVVTPEA